MSGNLLKKVGKFETHHRILVFSAVVIVNIFLLRFLVQFYNPNPVLFNLELHHFDYGVILLLVTVKLLLFGSRKYENFYLLLAAVSSALIIDGYLALRLAVVENHNLQFQIYNSTMTPVIISVVISTLTILFINSIRKH
ncbi:hypothetical protein A2W67_01230 [Candidatus Nomurabacteria bacterium RIFCSPLOWO2_02_40_28]|nr:MAG: hypothetical protein A2W50_01275 [Candidatus Nomurabacteria bacterium RIFCSPHIGHO2_02_40_30]OGI79883.1 MAG: hypothetical protein A2W43_01965 [Candidatus Nomurabacteria bacterium RIFCSPHIGHO2_12_40_11]OGI82383.1 MAG: hypothetical protein A3E33_00175 [Candidatus Nomurabacteria bacterium RIFCSPHIGHO2_12_FULL_40_77]OGI96649.1 MAG: hypothetical protein A2W67_01230 [Candidatus Nomurabacteria bacterium RIFCSPLOWO2_02_40_28]OGI99130.1 MAG: hypothetical protein A2W78_02360 [Candidatus Nomurabact